MPYEKLERKLTSSCTKRDRRKVERRNQLQKKFDEDMTGMEQKIGDLVERTADEL